jgi:serine protease Do
MRKGLSFVSLFVVAVLALTACNAAAINTQANANTATAPQSSAPVTAVAQAPAAALPATGSGATNSLIAAYEGTLETIYQQVNPSVVNIQVTEQSSTSQNPFSLPFFNFPQQQVPQVQQALGSGFVWDNQGHIVTNNHVVAGATNITVTFSDGRTVPAKVVGTDVNSDLAVIQVNVPASQLHPVTMASSSSVKVGQLAIAIGNPFGLSGTMTTGIVSALGRSLPAGDTNTGGPTYTIPDVIQTDAPINPGNSGGVLLNAEGQVIGVTAAIESSTQSSAGIGFVIPSDIVNKVVPELIKNGKFTYSYLGVEGTTLDPTINKAMNLSSDQQGALIISVTPGGPADKAGLRGGSQQINDNGNQVAVGGDVIVSIDNQPVKNFDDVVSYLINNTQPGQKVDLGILRDGKQMTVTVTLGTRPNTPPATSQVPQLSSSSAFLGIAGVTLSRAIDQAMNLPASTRGVLVEQVQPGSPADQAGIRAGNQTVNVNGRQIVVGGDIIVAFNGQPVATLTELQDLLSQAHAGQQVTITVLRNGRQIDIQVTLGQAGS